MRGLMRTSYAASYAEWLYVLCAPHICLMRSVMRDLRRIRPLKNRALESTSYAPLTPHKTFVE